MPGIIVPFVGEPHRDTISIVRPKLFDQPVVQFFCPFACEKFNDLLPPCGKFSAISPLRLEGVGESDLFWIAVSRVKGGSGGRVAVAVELFDSGIFVC